MAIKKGKLIRRIISLIILFIFIAVFVTIYNKYNFNYYMKSVREPHLTTFERDKEVKYSDTNSYKITRKYRKHDKWWSTYLHRRYNRKI